MGGEDTPIGVQESAAWTLGACFFVLAQLPHGFDHMSYAAGDPAVPVGQEPAMGVKRQWTIAVEASIAHLFARFAKRGEAARFQQHRQGYCEAIIDAKPPEYTALGFCLCRCGGPNRAGGDIFKIGCGKMLVQMRLCRAGDLKVWPRFWRIGRYQQRGAAIGNRAAIEP